MTTVTDTFPLISWGRAQGSSLSALVVSTRAHRFDPTDETRTLCGVKIPYVARHSTRGVGHVTALQRVYGDDDRETARQPLCQRCDAAATRRSAAS
ncbi:hypothetical protein [Cellulosimicrobium sp. Marseille-Q4280]|uniref:hypothetical protein n=1 Tax=Cellulosimicrobium sp. Marseille-Q4280 TaxID=2937992 RepID=UPI00203F7A00|nr:hypothetical protein [Cellulosimicrobium sp. Marseille-Q4280]